MATVFWVGNSINTPGQATGQVTVVVNGATFTATINGKALTFTAGASDTTSTAAAGLQALCAASDAPPEFGMLSWSVATDTITVVGPSDGRPFLSMTGGLVFSAAAGGTIVQTTTVTAKSQSDVGLAANWNRAGSAAIPVNGDLVIVADSTIPLLYNLEALVLVQFSSYVRWQSFSAQIGLPENNPLGFVEYLPTYFKFIGSVSPLAMTLGYGNTGSGPTRERYNLGAHQVVLTILASGSAEDDYAIRFLGTSASNIFYLTGTSLGIAMLPGEVSTIAGGSRVDGGGTLAMGLGCNLSGNITIVGGSFFFNNTPGGSVTADQGSQITAVPNGGTIISFILRNGSSATWLANCIITTLTMETGSSLDNTANLQGITITNSTIDGYTCQILDPSGTITYTNATTVRNGINAGPFTTSAGKTVKIT